MAYRFKDPGPGRDSGRMMGGMDNDKLSRRDDMDDLGRGPRGQFSRDRRLSPGRDKPFSERGRGFGRDDGPSGNERDRSPLPRMFEDRFLDRDRFKRDELPFPRRDELGGHKEMSRSLMDVRDPFRGEKFMDKGREEPRGFGSRFDMPDDSYRQRGLNLPSKGGFMNKNDMMRPNECEIIVVNKQQRTYAESIELRLKNLGIQVDILFLKDEALLVQTIDDIARRGCLYAMVVTLLNESRGSVTLNILYGNPQEHRNMPLDDALKLVARNFHDHIRSQRDLMDRDRQERGNLMMNFPADKEMQFLFRLLADGRQLSIGELDTVIKHLNERKDKLKPSPSGPETSGPPQTGPPSSDVDSTAPKADKHTDLAKKEQDLQNRIMNIMNQGGDDEPSPVGIKKPDINIPGIGDLGSIRPQVSNSGGGMNRHGMGQMPSGNSSLDQSPASRQGINQPNMANANQSSSTYINFDNPSVKKALDSLMQSGPNLLKSLSGSSNSGSMGNQSMQDKMQGNLGGPMGGQRPPMGIGDSGPLQSSGMGLPHNRNMGSADGRNMGLPDRSMGPPDRSMGPPDRSMGPPDRSMGPSDRSMGPPDRNMGPLNNRNMGSLDNRSMNVLDNRGMGLSDNRNMGMMSGSGGMNSRQGANMGLNSGPMGNMGPGSFQDRPGMFGGNPNMMGNRPPHMGGPMGNQGMGGGPRRY